MIARLWHGRTLSKDAGIYRQYVIDTGIQDYRQTRGNLGAQIWQRTEADVTHIWTLSWWEDYDCIRLFAGQNIESAHYYEEDKKYLLEFEPQVIHAEVFDFRPGL
jgi:heme-degrading monooxygenase HmoA